jgi:hypothetical protein
MMSAVRRSSSSRPRGRLRWMDRSCPSAAHARRSDTSSVRRTCSMHALRRAGLSSFPLPLPEGSACPVSGQKPPCAGAGSQPRDPSFDGPGRYPARRTPTAICDRSRRSRRSIAPRPPQSGPTPSSHPPAGAWRRSPPACASSLAFQSSVLQFAASGRTTSMGVDQCL